MCGPTPAELQLQEQEATLSKVMTADFNQRFGTQTDVLAQLQQALSPIVAQGPDQTGFSANELAARQSQVLDTTAANYQNAARAAAGQTAGRVGDSGLESGIDRQIKASVATSAARDISAGENALTQENYATGRQNFSQAVAGEQALSGELNPASFGSEATSADSSAFGQADKIQQQQNALWKDIAGGVTGLAESFIPKPGGGSGGGGFPGFDMENSGQEG